MEASLLMAVSFGTNTGFESTSDNAAHKRRVSIFEGLQRQT